MDSLRKRSYLLPQALLLVNQCLLNLKMFKNASIALLPGPPNANQRLQPLLRWPKTASGKKDQQTDIQTITVWGGVEEIPIP